jgi:uncharacterized Zn finger protein
VGSVLEEFQHLHYQACELASPDPLVLADYLLRAEMDSSFGSFSNAVETYADLLGDAGLAHYRELAELMWQKFSTLTPQDGEWKYKRRKLQRILETLARKSGDLEAVVAIKRRDLSSPHTYLEIAQLYLQDGQSDRALEWAESGLTAFDRSNNSLRNFVIEEYLRRGRSEDAMELAWQAFTEPFITLNHYQTLKTQAEKVNQWPIWRENALAYIRQQLEPSTPPSQARQATRTSRRHQSPVRSKIPYGGRKVSHLSTKDHALLVEIFLWEGADDWAWQEAQEGGCSQKLWLRLADRRQLTHPADALPIYQQEIESLIQQTNNTAYASAVSLLHKVHDLMLRLNQSAEFQTFVTRLRQTYKAKRNFVSLLNQQQW